MADAKYRDFILVYDVNLYRQSAINAGIISRTDWTWVRLGLYGMETDSWAHLYAIIPRVPDAASNVYPQDFRLHSFMIKRTSHDAKVLSVIESDYESKDQTYTIPNVELLMQRTENKGAIAVFVRNRNLELKAIRAIHDEILTPMVRQSQLVKT